MPHVCNIKSFCTFWARYPVQNASDTMSKYLQKAKNYHPHQISIKVYVTQYPILNKRNVSGNKTRLTMSILSAVLSVNLRPSVRDILGGFCSVKSFLELDVLLLLLLMISTSGSGSFDIDSCSLLLFTGNMVWKYKTSVVQNVWSSGLFLFLFCGVW